MKRSDLLKGMDTRKALFGLFFAFGNRLQTAGDAFYEEITCKQFFLLICLSLFRDEPPTINDLSKVMGSSHQNVKQIVNKLEKNGYVVTFCDKEDKRKLRIQGTEKIMQLGEKYEQQENDFMERFFEGVSDEELEVTFRVMNRLENNLIEIRRDCE